MFGLSWGQPVTGADPMAFRALDAADGGGGFRCKKSVVGGLVREFADGAQPDVDRGGREALFFEGGAVALDGGFIELGGAIQAAPLVEIVEGLAVSPAGVGGGDAVEDQGFDLLPAIFLGDDSEVRGHRAILQ